MFKRHRTVISGLLIVLVAGCISSPPAREFAIQDLLINEDHYPSNWDLYEGPRNIPSNEGQEEGVYITFNTDAPVGVRSGEDVYRYDNERNAAWHFNRFVSDYFNDNSVYNQSPWTMPAELPYVSTVANQSRFACAEKSYGKTICIFISQYGEFLVFATATIAAEGVGYMEFSELKVILQAIDQAMADHGLGQE
jgi:hypothetical protein